MSAKVLGDKDVNAPLGGDQQQQQATAGGKDVKSMEYHRQMFQSKVHEEYAPPPHHLPASLLHSVGRNSNNLARSSSKQYVSPSDNIMSPCTAKINALRNKQVSK
jgi:hypothetical protein